VADDRLDALTAAGVSIWLDDLSRGRLVSGDLRRLIKDKHVVGVTTNPTIFAAALAHCGAYTRQIRELARLSCASDGPAALVPSPVCFARRRRLAVAVPGADPATGSVRCRPRRR
jgi:Transaldolase/Fructose-6-phosphate aldolase